MNKMFLVFVLALFSMNTQAVSFGVINKKSELSFSIQKFAIGKAVDGSFKNFSGELEFNETTLKNLKGKVIVDSINTGDEKRDGHLKSGDFFASSNHPFITFESKGETKFKFDESFKQAGFLTIKDHKKPVTLELTIKEDKAQIIVTGKTVINRYDYGVTWNKRQDKTDESLFDTIANFSKGLGDKYVIDKDVDISFKMTFLPNAL